jgi:L-iditol 2-dehydrogenase
MTQVLRGAVGFQGTLLVSEPNPHKRKLVASFGAETWDPSQPGIEEWVQEKSGGRMLEWAFEASGVGQAIASMPRLLRKQATVIKYGIGHHGQGLELLNDFHWKEPTFLMPVGASSPFDEDGRATYYRQALQWIESGKVQVEPMISHRYSGLEEVPKALGDDHKSPEYIKGIVEFQV